MKFYALCTLSRTVPLKISGLPLDIEIKTKKSLDLCIEIAKKLNAKVNAFM
jgi:hypothetical protein